MVIYRIFFHILAHLQGSRYTAVLLSCTSFCCLFSQYAEGGLFLIIEKPCRSLNLLSNKASYTINSVGLQVWACLVQSDM